MTSPKSSPTIVSIRCMIVMAATIVNIQLSSVEFKLASMTHAHNLIYSVKLSFLRKLLASKTITKPTEIAYEAAMSGMSQIA